MPLRTLIGFLLGRRQAILDHGHHMAGAPQGAGQELPHVVVVVGYQNTRHMVLA